MTQAKETTTNAQQKQMAQPVTGEWKSGLLGCTDNCYNCCMVAFCPCVTFGQISERIGHNGCCDHYSCCTNGALFALASMVGCGCYMQCLLREKVGRATGVETKALGNCCASFFLAPCAMCQMANQVGLQKEKLSFGAPARMETMQRI